MAIPRTISPPMISGSNAPSAPAELPSNTGMNDSSKILVISFFSSYRLSFSLVFSSLMVYLVLLDHQMVYPMME